jgi:hypothetical protein
MNNNILDSEDYRGFTINIYHDEIGMDNDDPIHDRTISQLVSFHRNYGNNFNYNNPDDVILSNKGNPDIRCFLVHGYEHGGIAFSLSNESYPFNDKFDSGVYGVLIFNFKEWDLKRTQHKTIRKRAEQLLKDYQAWVNGEVYYYDVKYQGNETDMNYGGFLGSDWDYMIKDAMSNIEHHIKWKTKKHINKLKWQIKNRVPLIYRKEFQLV